MAITSHHCLPVWLSVYGCRGLQQPVAQTVKTLPAMCETWAQSLGWKDPLEKEMATHSGVLAWRIPGTEEPGRLAVYGVAQSWTRLKQLSSSMLSKYRVTIKYGNVNCRM